MAVQKHRRSARRLAAQIDLVAQDEHRYPGWNLDEQFRKLSRISRIDDQQGEIGDDELTASARYTLLLHRVDCGAETGGIDNVQRQAIDVDLFTDQIAGRAWLAGDDRGRIAGECVEEARLAAIGSTGEHHMQAVTQQTALASGSFKVCKAGCNDGDAPLEFAVAQQLDFFVRKVDGGLDVDAQTGQLLVQRQHRSGKIALQ